MAYKDKNKKLEYQREWRKKNLDKLLEYNKKHKIYLKKYNRLKKSIFERMEENTGINYNRKPSDKQREVARKMFLDNNPMKNEKSIKKLSNNTKGEKHFVYNKKMREKMMKFQKETWNTPEKKEFAKERRSKQILPLRDSSIEIKIQNYLKELNIGFFTHIYMDEILNSYQCDILIPVQKNKDRFIQQPIIIECDGDYWHSYPVGRDIDRIRTSELIDKGFKVLRLWEHDIKAMDLNKFKEIVC